MREKRKTEGRAARFRILDALTDLYKGEPVLYSDIRKRVDVNAWTMSAECGRLALEGYIRKVRAGKQMAAVPLKKAAAAPLDTTQPEAIRPVPALRQRHDVGLSALHNGVLVALCDLHDCGVTETPLRTIVARSTGNTSKLEPGDKTKDAVAMALREMVDQGYVGAKGEKNARQYRPLRRPDGSDYVLPETVIENGVPVTRLPPRNVGACFDGKLGL